MQNKAMACLAGAALMTALTACGTMKKMVDAIPVPSIPNIIPGLGSDSPPKPDDPKVPFNAKGTLGYGHTLDLLVYDGARNPKKLYSGKAMIDERGVLTLEEIGSAKLGGRTLPEARAMIGSIFRSAGRVAAQVHVHIISVEGVDMIAVDGDVNSPTVTPLWDDATVNDAITMAGGRRASSAARAVYVTHEGTRKFYNSAARADDETSLEAGDIVTLSSDL